MAEPCLFCDPTAHKILTENDFGYARLDNFPANPGHVEVVPWKHVDSWFDLSLAEQTALCELLAQAKTLIVAEHGTPDAWTIGINDGRAAGRSIDHLHVHLIPRWHGDVDDPRGGIRQCAPNCDPDAWTKETPHAGNGNAEDCPICRPLIDQPGGVLYPWHCTAADQPEETR